MPFEVPSGWVWCRLGDVISIKSGDSIRVRDNRQGEYPIYGGNGINGYYSDCNVEPDTIVIGRVGFYCGSVHQTISKAWVTDNAFIVSCESVFNSKYLCHLLEWLQLSKTSNSTAQPVISGKGIYPLLIPLPPLYEQERIVSEAKRCFTLIAQIEQGKSDLQTIIKQAKSKILDLATHGKLVPQDPNDESAIELLKRINPGITPCDNGHRRKLPQGWAYCQLSNVLKITMGQSPRGDSLNNKKGIEFHQGKICFSDKFLLDSGIYTNEPTKIAEPNSILLCVRAPVGVVNITKNQICIGRGLCALTPFEGNADFYFYLLQTLQDSFDNQSTGTTFKAISGEIIRNENIILPPLAEQQRIVQKIEELFHVLDNIQNALEV